MVVAEPANGIVAMPIKRERLELDEIGYVGWWVDLRMNPRSEYYDLFLQNISEHPDKVWEGFSNIVIDWNFGDENGKKIPLPIEGTRILDLPMDVVNYMFSRFLDLFNKHATIPKVSDSSSKDTSQTKSEQQSIEDAQNAPTHK